MKSPATLVVPALIAVVVQPATAIELTSETVAEWNRYVAAASAHLHESGADDFPGQPDGRVIDAPSGTIHHWRGSTLVHRTTVDRVVNALMYPGTPPPQDDVLESRVLGRKGNTLRVYLKLARSTIVTVVYDTEHDVTFERYAAGLAASRSVSTKIAETGGSDRGFLWRLNSYWRYTQVGNDVRIDLESISLSRDVPWFAQPLAGRLIRRIGRESITRTLSSVRCFLEKDDAGSCAW